MKERPKSRCNKAAEMRRRLRVQDSGSDVWQVGQVGSRGKDGRRTAGTRDAGRGEMGTPCSTASGLSWDLTLQKCQVLG